MDDPTRVGKLQALEDRASRPRAEQLLGTLPDSPRWVETRGMLLLDDCEIFGSPRPGCVVRSARSRLLGAVGRPGARTLERATAGAGRTWFLLAPPESAEDLAQRLPDWNREQAILHTLPAGAAPVAPAGAAEVRPIGTGESLVLDHLPSDLRREIAAAAGRVPMVAAFADGLPVSFCYSWLETETLWDVSVDTLPAYRRRGLAGACAVELIRRMRRLGKEPVWAATEQNLASLRLADRLGFVPVDRLAVFTPLATRS